MTEPTTPQPGTNQDAAVRAAQVAFAVLNPGWAVLGVTPGAPLPHARVQRWERYRLLGHRINNGLDDENTGPPPARCQAIENRARRALLRATIADAKVAPPRQPSGQARPSSGQVRCRWQRCTSPASDRVFFAQPHRLAGQERAYWPIHTTQATRAPGAVLLHRRPTPSQLNLLATEPGTEEPARP